MKASPSVVRFVRLDLLMLGMATAGNETVVPWMKAPTLTATTARIWVTFLAFFGALKKNIGKNCQQKNIPITHQIESYALK
jgi:hypothetical protein